ncbi:MAG: hypothetical protein CMF52_06495 [Legionellales bacterium]|nr:hypothetical protein [Legionellales bacterium]
MILQTLDVRDNCRGAFYKNKLVIEPEPDFYRNFNIAWKHSKFFDDSSFTYLYLFAKEEDIEKYSPNPKQYRDCIANIRAQERAASLAKIDLRGECFFDLFPKSKLEKYFSCKLDALENVYANVKKPSDYDILHKAHVLCATIRNQQIIFRNKRRNINYNIFGTSTGRLSTRPKTLPILNLKKEDRQHLYPSNDLFVEFDYNAAEIRMLLALANSKQPDEDIHNFNMQVLKLKDTTRQQAKERFFAWLYNPEAKDSKLEKIYNKNIYRDYYVDGVIKTPFGREMIVEEKKALNYLTQSTTSDMVIENSYKIQKFLKSRESKIAFLLHDSIILDVSRDDVALLSEVKQIFEKTRWGSFLTSSKIGRNFLEMKEVEI